MTVGMSQHAEQLGHHGFETICEGTALEEVAYLILIIHPPLGDGSRNTVDMGLLADVVAGQLTQFFKLLNHRGDDEVDDATDNGNDEDERQDDTQRTGQVHAALHELHDWIKQVGEEPGDNKRQQHTTQIVNQQQDAQNQQACSYPAYKAVKRDGLFFHFLLVLLFDNIHGTEVRIRWSRPGAPAAGRPLYDG